MANNLKRGKDFLRSLEALATPSAYQVRHIHEDYREPVKAWLVSQDKTT